MPKFIDLTGKKFNCLTVLEYDNSKKYHVICLCECGAKISVWSGSLTGGKTKSCGCFNKKDKVGNKYGLIHGHSYTPEYRIWRDIKIRCINPKSYNYEYYGGRGIKICPEWLESFEKFLNDMGKRPDECYRFERIDTDKDFTKDNCWWVARNKKRVEV